ncbi:UDP-N-acetylmuramoyl-L-alanine--D-glutamate ligase [Glaciecola sp. XM2]|uniref:UDP-N-acetylmuramoyl-L-alanine--D-glutamate ligase n=1 Tax=Glaciecola sp. XM2 TaxID=1914931 RepID=UPI001BDF681A|nr:UDP-N-acetylmuramoyl-L-alanine--D-glutamate ligase [Glaciecola sp. XM2]MBT1450510.1 UDP-N-acetylmuramoyl-L-alanine--D-glutamate ligase [Glaciecola sp. XM2]
MSRATSPRYQQYRNMPVAVIGLGVTGRACLKFLLDNGARVTGFDRAAIERKDVLAQIAYEDTSSFNLSRLENSSVFDEFELVILSPGVNPSHEAIAPLIGQVKLISDLDLFTRHNKVKCIGVTGSNGKSTVVDMLHKALQACSKTALLGGNFGTCAIDLLDIEADYIILELSSFQLQISQNIPLEIACILNVTEDHIDRHGSFANYALAKQYIFKHAHAAIINRDDAATLPLPSINKNVTVFASVGQSAAANENDFWQDERGVHQRNLCLIEASDLPLPLTHMMLNMQFVLAMLNALHIELAPAIDALISYQGLAHRFEVVLESDNMTFVNDSKATNPGACAAAINCATRLQGNIILIAGGDAKGADVSALKPIIDENVSLTIVYGKDAKLFADLLNNVKSVSNLDEAVDIAIHIAKETADKVLILLSPACSSTDMFANYQARGNAFKQAVMRVAA